MRRRELILLLASPLTASRAPRAQQKAVPVIGYLGGAAPGPFAPFVTAFRQGLSEAGYVEGQNLAIEYRWAEGRFDRLPALAADLVGHKVDVIVTTGGITSALAAKNATSTIPIVFSIGRPGRGRPGRQFLPAGLQPHWIQHDARRGDAQAGRGALGAGPPSRRDRSALTT